MLRRGEIWRIEGARERLGLVISSDVYNGTDVPIVLVAEVVPEELLRDSPLAVTMAPYVVMPDRLSSPLQRQLRLRGPVGGHVDLRPAQLPAAARSRDRVAGRR